MPVNNRPESSSDYMRPWRRSGTTDDSAAYILMLELVLMVLDLIMQLQSGMGVEGSWIFLFQSCVIRQE